MHKTRDITPQRAPAKEHTTINIHLIPAPSRPTQVHDAVADAMAPLTTIHDGLDGLRASVARAAHGLDRIAPLIEARKAMKDADARAEARRERATPASVNAANAARWGRKA